MLPRSRKGNLIVLNVAYTSRDQFRNQNGIEPLAIATGIESGSQIGWFSNHDPHVGLDDRTHHTTAQ